MDGNDRARRLFWHGMILVLVGLLMGTVVQSVANPRMGLSAHTGTLMNGGHVGTAWQEALVGAGLTVGGVALLVGCALAIWGLRRPSPR